MLILYLLISGPIIVSTMLFVLIQILGALLIIWAFLAIRHSKKTSTKLPRGYFFVTTGPYEIIRHPIYAGIFFLLFTLVQSNLTFFRLLAFFLLILIAIKAMRSDELVMQQMVKEYIEYQTKTKRIIPYLY